LFIIVFDYIVFGHVYVDISFRLYEIGIVYNTAVFYQNIGYTFCIDKAQGFNGIMMQVAVTDRNFFCVSSKNSVNTAPDKLTAVERDSAAVFYINYASFSLSSSGF
jgi:hypothetical protein